MGTQDDIKGNTPPPPFQLGQWVYLAQQMAVVTTSKGSAHPDAVTMVDVDVDGPASGISTVGSPLSLNDPSPIITADIASNVATCRQELLLLRQDSANADDDLILDQFAWNDSNCAVQNISYSVSDASITAILGYVPEQESSENPADTPQPVLLAGYDGTSVSVHLFAMDPSNPGGAVVTQNWSLPLVNPGKIVDGFFVRNQLYSYVVLLGTTDNGDGTSDIQAYGFPLGLLQHASLTSFEDQITQLTVGTMVSGCEISAVVARTIADSSNQQLAVTYVDPNNACQLTMLGYGPVNSTFDKKDPSETKFAFQQLRTLALNVGDVAPVYSNPDHPSVRLAAADLNHSGFDDIIAAYPTNYGGVDGAVALILCGTDDGTFRQIGKPYVICAPDQQPLASAGLQIAAGVFGCDNSDPSEAVPYGQLGIAVMGKAANMIEAMNLETEVIVGMVCLNPYANSFPEQASNTATDIDQAANIMTASMMDGGFFGAGVDFAGNSVVLGRPTLQPQNGARGQVLAVLAVPPYQSTEDGIVPKYSPPSLTFSEETSGSYGQSVSANHSWTQTHHLSAHIGFGSSQLRHRISNSYGENFGKARLGHERITITVSLNIETNDQLMLYAMSYWVWTYPVFRMASSASGDGSSASGGTVTVAFPQFSSSASSPSFVPAADQPDIGYYVPYEPGCLLSYYGADMLGYLNKQNIQNHPNPLEEAWLNHIESLSGELSDIQIQNDAPSDDSLTERFTYFSCGAIEVDSTNLTPTVNFSSTSSNRDHLSHHVHNTTSNSVNFAFRAGQMFKYFPLNFGLNVGNRNTDSSRGINTTTLNSNNAMSFTFSSGYIEASNQDFFYTFTPILYAHASLGCMVLGYQINSLGEGWQKAYSLAYPMIIKPNRSSNDPLLASYSRAISFFPSGERQGERGTQDLADDTSLRGDGTTILVEIFNRGFAQTSDVFCAAFLGQPIFDNDGNLVRTKTGQAFPGSPDGQGSPATLNGSSEQVAMPYIGGSDKIEIDSCARTTVEIAWPSAQLGQVVTILVWGAGSRNISEAEIAWNVYPESDYATMDV